MAGGGQRPPDTGPGQATALVRAAQLFAVTRLCESPGTCARDPPPSDSTRGDTQGRVLSERAEGGHTAGVTWRRGVAVSSQTHGIARPRDRPGPWSLRPVPWGRPAAYDRAEAPPAVGRGSRTTGTSSRAGAWGADATPRPQGPGLLRRAVAPEARERGRVPGLRQARGPEGGGRGQRGGLPRRRPPHPRGGWGGCCATARRSQTRGTQGRGPTQARGQPASVTGGAGATVHADPSPRTMWAQRAAPASRESHRQWTRSWHPPWRGPSWPGWSPCRLTVQADHADAWEHAPPAAPRDGFPGRAPIPRTPAPEMWLAKQTLTPPGLSLKTDTQFRYRENFLMLNFRNAKHIEYFQMKIYCPDLVRE